MNTHAISRADLADCLAAAACSALAAVLRLGMDPLVGSHHEFVPAYVAIAAATWFGSWRAAAMTALAAIVIEHLTQSRAVDTLVEAVAYAGFAGLSLLIVGAVEWLKREHRESATLAARLRTADRRKSDFVALLGHELRNPLSTIAMATRLLRAGGLDAKARQSTWDALERQTDHMTRLVGDLLDISRIEQGKLELHRERLDVSAVIEDAIADVRSRTEAKQQKVVHRIRRPGGQVFADPLRIGQVLVNLLHNASKFSPEGSSIQVAVDASAEAVTITVRDAGAGIPPDQLERVFESFVQLAPSTGQPQGLGLGLGLSRQLVQLHGGTLHAHSEGPGTGSSFVIRLPRSVPVAGGDERAAPAEPAEVAGSSRRLLVVDDNADAAATLAVLLRLMGHQAFTAGDGRQAIEIAAKEQPDLVFLDIALPDMSGLEVAVELRRRAVKQPVLVALTGWASEHDKELSRRAGFDAHLTKPVSPEAIQAALRVREPAAAAADVAVPG